MMASDAGSEAQAGTGVGSSKSVPSSAPARSTSSPVRRKPSDVDVQSNHDFSDGWMPSASFHAAPGVKGQSSP